MFIKTESPQINNPLYGWSAEYPYTYCIIFAIGKYRHKSIYPGLHCLLIQYSIHQRKISILGRNMWLRRRKKGSSFKVSDLKQRLFLLGSSLVFTLFFIGGVLLTKIFLFENPNISISRLENFLILAVFGLMYVGICILLIRPLLDQVLLMLKTRGILKTEEALGSREIDLEFQQKSIAALLSISESKGDFLPLDQVFHHALRVIQDITGFNTVVIRLIDEKSNTLNVVAQQGMSPEMLEELAVVNMENPILREIFRSFMPYPINDLAAEDVSMVGASPPVSGFRSAVFIPLVSGDVSIGTIDLGSKKPHLWNQDELRWLALVGRAVGSIVHRVNLTERIHSFAALEERTRVAQEIHDGLVQLIDAINIWSKEAREAIIAEEYAALEDAITRIETYSSDANLILREELLGLRDTLDADRDFYTVLGEYLSRFNRQWGIEVELIMEKSQDIKISQIISSSAQIQLLRIIQESMINVHRHAQATKVTIDVSADDNNLRIGIEDNGQGFQVDDVEGNHFGLKIMRERVTSVAGDIKLESEPGLGTKIEIKIPQQKSEIVHRRVE